MITRTIFFSIMLRFNPYWDYTIANICTSEKSVNTYRFGRADLKRDCDEGRIVDGLIQSIWFVIALEKTPSSKILYAPEKNFKK